MATPPPFTQLRISADLRPVSRGESLALWLIGGAFGVLILAAVLQQFVPQKLSIVFFVVFWFAMLVLHELGHALMAKALGWRVSEMMIGFGPRLWRGRVGETRIELRLIPVEGYVVPAPVTPRFARLKSALIYAAGPGIQLLLLAALIAGFGWDTVFNDSTDLALVALETLAIVIVWSAGFNLIPFRVDDGVSDGLGILLSPFMSDDTVTKRTIALDIDEALRLADAGRHDEALAVFARLRERFPERRELILREARLLADAGRHDAARASLGALRKDRPIVEIDDVALLHTIALVEMARPDADYTSIDLALTRALARTDNDPTLRISRGAALVARGRAEEGGNLIADAFIEAPSLYDRARALGYLAIAAHRCHQREAARRFYAAFVHLNRSQTDRARVDAVLGADAG